MTIYYKDRAFYDCDTPDQAPEGARPVSPEQHAGLLASLNSGCIVSDDLTVSPPRPSDYHEWDGGSWVLKPTAQKKMLQQAKSEKLAEINRAAQSYIDLQRAWIKCQNLRWQLGQRRHLRRRHGMPTLMLQRRRLTPLPLLEACRPLL